MRVKSTSRTPPASPNKKEEEDYEEIPEVLNRLISSRAPEEGQELNEAASKLQGIIEAVRRDLD